MIQKEHGRREFVSMHPFDLSGKTALVTGGSKGIGRAIALQLAEAGADLFLCSRGEEALEKTAGEIAQSTGRNVLFETADMAIRSEVVRTAASALEQCGKIDILINNAGHNIPAPIDRIEDEDWDHLVELNLTAVMAMTRAIVPSMKENRWGRVIHISSVMGLGSTPQRNAYSATKAALIGMVRATALDLGPLGITVNCIAPGPIATEMPMSILSKEQQESFAARTALKRWGTPEEIAGPALMMASEAGRYITGTCLLIDGGVLANVF
jgi:NAD(P)-dependent dehydrogenase (short-subunit alcohol dehydrogenase family)